MSAHLRLIQTVERTLAEFYGFDLQASSTDHLVTDKNIASLPEHIGKNRGCVVVVETGVPDEIEIGIRLSPVIIDKVTADDPLICLSNTNLDSFCVVAEEISHFHMICNRAHAEHPVSKLELEIQGEIDKMLLAAGIMYEQSGNAHLLPLARMLFDQARIESEEEDLYREASKHAADFWYSFIRRADHSANPFYNRRLRRQLRASYIASLGDKLENLKIKKAS